MKTKDIKYKWTRIFAAKRFGGVDPIKLPAIEQYELLQDLENSEPDQETASLLLRINTLEEQVRQLNLELVNITGEDRG